MSRGGFRHGHGAFRGKGTDKAAPYPVKGETVMSMEITVKLDAEVVSN